MRLFWTQFWPNFDHPFSIKNLLRSSEEVNLKDVHGSFGNKDLESSPSAAREYGNVSPLNLSLSTVPYFPSSNSIGSLSPTSSNTGTEYSSESPLPHLLPSPLEGALPSLVYPKASLSPLFHPASPYPSIHHENEVDSRIYKYNAIMHSMMLSTRAHPYHISPQQSGNIGSYGLPNQSLTNSHQTQVNFGVHSGSPIQAPFLRLWRLFAFFSRFHGKFCHIFWELK